MTDEIPSDLGRYDQGQRDNRKKDTLKHFVRLQQEEIFSYLLNKRIIAEHMQLTANEWQQFIKSKEDQLIKQQNIQDNYINGPDQVVTQTQSDVESVSQNTLQDWCVSIHGAIDNLTIPGLNEDQTSKLKENLKKEITPDKVLKDFIEAADFLDNHNSEETTNETALDRYKQSIKAELGLKLDSVQTETVDTKSTRINTLFARLEKLTDPGHKDTNEYMEQCMIKYIKHKRCQYVLDVLKLAMCRQTARLIQHTSAIMTDSNFDSIVKCHNTINFATIDLYMNQMQSILAETETETFNRIRGLRP